MKKISLLLLVSFCFQTIVFAQKVGYTLSGVSVDYLQSRLSYASPGFSHLKALVKDQPGFESFYDTVKPYSGSFIVKSSKANLQFHFTKLMDTVTEKKELTFGIGYSREPIYSSGNYLYYNAWSIVYDSFKGPGMTIYFDSLFSKKYNFNRSSDIISFQVEYGRYSNPSKWLFIRYGIGFDYELEINAHLESSYEYKLDRQYQIILDSHYQYANPHITYQSNTLDYKSQTFDLRKSSFWQVYLPFSFGYGYTSRNGGKGGFHLDFLLRPGLNFRLFNLSDAQRLYFSPFIYTGIGTRVDF